MATWNAAAISQHNTCPSFYAGGVDVAQPGEDFLSVPHIHSMVPKTNLRE